MKGGEIFRRQRVLDIDVGGEVVGGGWLAGGEEVDVAADGAVDGAGAADGGEEDGACGEGLEGGVDEVEEGGAAAGGGGGGGEEGGLGGLKEEVGEWADVVVWAFWGWAGLGVLVGFGPYMEEGVGVEGFGVFCFHVQTFPDHWNVVFC